ncbi:conserved Plasmodium protein, unknown function [Plasmodium sp. gorilla clade G2]|uniref:conserved Plasmodium protein, unknown function n=1 Tax=Plasmodium sp. gorilla clade G2 TaxID=880535 RepID=UPI000D213E5F|nr:conserved Plasmodium protein, unknown function [Plasmodium sp. gorilla clade G2]SOV14118.1 conserved Plasmodium protein, unknown function [Plasmodium sp. gorilla clade G2]
MEKIKTLVPLIVGTYGLSLSSYKIYEDKKKKTWDKINGQVDKVTLRCDKNFFQRSYYLNVSYNFFLDNKKYIHNKEYKLEAHLFPSNKKNEKNKENKNNNNKINENNIKKEDIKPNIYTQNIFDQVCNEKNITIIYNPNNKNETDPLIYINENSILSNYNFIGRIKNKLLCVKTCVINKTKNFLKIDTLKNNSQKQKYTNDKNEQKNKSTNQQNIINENNLSLFEDINKNSDPSHNFKRHLINSYDINNLFPMYMLSCSLFLFSSFFFKRRIHNVKNKISQQ